MVFNGFLLFVLISMTIITFTASVSAMELLYKEKNEEEQDKLLKVLLVVILLMVLFFLATGWQIDRMLF